MKVEHLVGHQQKLKDGDRKQVRCDRRLGRNGKKCLRRLRTRLGVRLGMRLGTRLGKRIGSRKGKRRTVKRTGSK